MLVPTLLISIIFLIFFKLSYFGFYEFIPFFQKKHSISTFVRRKNKIINWLTNISSYRQGTSPQKSSTEKK